MTLTLNPSASIRPLEEEHLRMFRRVIGTLEAPPKIALHKEAYGLPKDLPKPESESSFTIYGRRYTMLIYGGEKGATLEETIKIAEHMGLQMFTLEDAKEIMDNRESTVALINEVKAMKPKYWPQVFLGYIRDHDAESQGRTTVFNHHSGKLYDVQHTQSEVAACLLIFKEK